MTYQVAVPSYQRAKTLSEKTLPLLRARGVPKHLITVFVADRQQEVEYRAALDSATYGGIVRGVVGMGAIRNFITDYYPEGTLLVSVDDDLSDVRYRVNDKKHEPLENLDEFFKEAFVYMQQYGATLWGVYPVLNAMFMKPRVRSDLTYIIGCLWGCVVSHDPKGYVSMDDKEDYERSIRRYVADGALARIEWVAPKTRYYLEPGGMQVERTEGRVRASAVELARRYPQLCTLNDTKKSGHLELRLKDKR